MVPFFVRGSRAEQGSTARLVGQPSALAAVGVFMGCWSPLRALRSVMTDPRLTNSGQKAILAAFLTHADGEGFSEPGYARVAKEASVSGRTVERVVPGLVALGWLVPSGTGRFGTVRYRLAPPEPTPSGPPPSASAPSGGSFPRHQPPPTLADNLSSGDELPEELGENYARSRATLTFLRKLVQGSPELNDLADSVLLRMVPLVTDERAAAVAVSTLATHLGDQSAAGIRFSVGARVVKLRRYLELQRPVGAAAPSGPQKQLLREIPGACALCRRVGGHDRTCPEARRAQLAAIIAMAYVSARSPRRRGCSRATSIV